MAKKKPANVGVKKKARKSREKLAEALVPQDLSEGEKDLLSHMESDWLLETDSLGGNPTLRNLKSSEVVRPPSANRSTVEALQERGLIAPGKSVDPLRIEWRMKGGVKR